MKKIWNIFFVPLLSWVVMVSANAQEVTKIAPGVWKVSYGSPEKYRPTDFKEAASEALAQMPDHEKAPFPLDEIKFSRIPKGTVAEFKMDKSEKIYGFGLQINTFEQSACRREIRTSSGVSGSSGDYHPSPLGDLGFSHAPMPFYISSKGYGVLINTSRYVTFYMGSQHKLDQTVALKQIVGGGSRASASIEDLYNRNYKSSDEVEVLVDGAQGMEMIIFDGPTLKNVIERYNLFAGGGGIPPIWGLGFKYRAKTDFTYKEVINFTRYFRENKIPCDMFGLEPGWQSSSYSCSYAWNKRNFPNPDSILNVIQGMNYKLNLWEHAYVHSTSPIFDSIVPYSGDFAVWKGAVPDFIMPQARRIFGEYHRNNLIKKGISAFKLDECDAAYYDEAHGEWSFPDIAKFPSGVDGEQMRQIFGLLYQKTLWDEFKKENKRTFLEARASYLFASPYCSALYSDMYSPFDYVTMVTNSGFAGVNWSPEVRQTKSVDDLIRRMQNSLMSSHMSVDCWFLKNLPWFQFDRSKNNNGEFLPDYKQLEQKVRKLVELRMRLIPYLYAAFAKYHYEGTPPFRALVVDYPDDPEVWRLDKQYMMGDDIMCAPFIEGVSEREVYFPKGIWYDFNTNKKYEGGKKYTIQMTLDQIPMFIKEGTILPLAKPVEFITPETVFEVNCKVYGNPANDMRLFEDDGFTFNFEKGNYNWLNLSWNGKKGMVKRSGNFRKKLFNISGWEKID